MEAVNQAKFEKYPKYKDSGVEWLGIIPEQWEVRRFKFLCDITTGGKNTEDKDKNGKYPFYVRSQVPEKINTYSFDGEAILTAGDGAGVGKVFHYVNEKFDFHQRVYKFSGFRNVLGKLCFYFIESFFHNVALNGEAKSTVDSLRLPLIQNFVITIPPVKEQNGIINFIETHSTKIDQAIAQKEKLIALLKERKQILIQEAVTKGLDPTVKLKDSGIDWIGQIPEHWEMKRCKYLFFETSERSEDGSEELLSVSHMTGVTPRAEKEVNMFLSEDYTGSKLCKEGDLVYNIMWAWMGALGVSPQSGIVSPSYGIYRQKKTNSFNGYFLEYKLKTTEYIEYYNKVSTGLHSSRLRFYAHMFMNMELAFPSRIEQDEIVKHINIQSSKIDTSIALQETQIEKLKEYKSVLIDSAVTGKIKVS